MVSICSRRLKKCGSATIFVLGLIVGGDAVAHAQLFGGNLLPAQNPAPNPVTANTLPKTFAQIQNGAAAVNSVVRQYTGNAGANNGPLSKNPGNDPTFNVFALLNGVNTQVGTLNFQYGAYTGEFNTTTDAQNSAAGMVIRGGFQLLPSVAVAPGKTLRFVQAYQESGRPDNNNATTIDDGTTNSSGASPLYPNFTQAGFTTFFADIPIDTLGTAQTPTGLLFELDLAGFDNATPQALQSIGSFQWSYSLTATDARNENVTGFSNTLGSILTNPFGPTGGYGSRGFTLSTNTAGLFVTAPEPGSLMLAPLGLALLGIAVRRRRHGTAS